MIRHVKVSRTLYQAGSVIEPNVIDAIQDGKMTCDMLFRHRGAFRSSLFPIFDKYAYRGVGPCHELKVYAFEFQDSQPLPRISNYRLFDYDDYGMTRIDEYLDKTGYTDCHVRYFYIAPDIEHDESVIFNCILSPC